MTKFEQLWAEMAMDTPLNEAMDATIPLKKLKEFIERAYAEGYKEGFVAGELSTTTPPLNHSSDDWKDLWRWTT